MIVAETERLLISKISAEDAEFYLQLVNTPNWIKYIGDRGVKTKEDAKKRIEDTILKNYEKYAYGAYKLTLKSTRELVGSCGLYKRDVFEYPDLGFAMLEGEEGKGYGYESSLAILKLAKVQFKIAEIYAITLPTNTSSIKLLKKLGLKHLKTEVFFEDDALMLFSKTL